MWRLDLGRREGDKELRGHDGSVKLVCGRCNLNGMMSDEKVLRRRFSSVGLKWFRVVRCEVW
jgi:hypothetical protein